MELKGSKTEQNLWTAFAGESQARNKYDYFASRAKKDGTPRLGSSICKTSRFSPSSSSMSKLPPIGKSTIWQLL